MDFAVSFDLLGLQRLAFVSSDFVDRVGSWIEGGLADRFYFMHKPPGLHLRFRARRRELLREVESFLAGQAAHGGLYRWRRAVYDSETSRFGGDVGIDIAHEFFTAESLLVLGYLRAGLRGETRLAPPQISLYLLLELFERIVEDRWELWDIWCKMALVDRVPPLTPAVLGRARLEAERAGAAIAPLLRDRSDVLATATAIERALLDACRSPIERVAHRLCRARLDGQLLYGLRSILPSWVVFHWNRMGLPPEVQTSISLVMIHLLGPDAGALPPG